MGSALRVLTSVTSPLEPALLAAAFEHCPEALAIAEQERILYANSAFADLFGYVDPAEVCGRELASLRPNSHRCWRVDSDDGASPGGSHPTCEFVSERRDGSRVRIESSCARLRAQDRELVVLTMRDVSLRERRRIIRDSDRRFRTIFEAAPMGIVQCGQEGQVLETNLAVERMLGRSRDELRGVFFQEFLHPDDRDTDSILFRELAEGKREAYEHELRYAGKGSASGWMYLKVSLVRGLAGEPQSAIAMIEDITERKRSEQRLREAQKVEAVGRLVGGVAHDFNNLLTGIMLYCDLLVAGLDPNSRQRQHADEIRLAGEHGRALILQLLAVSRQQVVEPRILCLNQVVGNSRNLLARLIGDNIELKLNLAEQIGNIRMDPAQLQQILFNLVLNARDAISGSGCITVETRNCAFAPVEPVLPHAMVQGVILAVTDSGCGMSAETRSHLFELFFTTKDHGRGNGLGLATVHSIVKNAGGTIQVESEVGHGSRFTVILPRVPEPPGVPMTEASHSPAALNETILLAEDNVTIRTAAKRILSESGYQVLEAGNGADALAIAQQNHNAIDLLLADLVMPGMTGRELAERVMVDCPSVRILYMSGYEPRGADESDPVVFFRKPFTGAELLQKVRQILDSEPTKNSKKDD
jgi:PAS domain S-box-containing protein